MTLYRGETVARRVRGFMCKTDWDHEIGWASDGNKVYPSIDSVRRERKCTAECGIVEVDVTFVRIVQGESMAAMLKAARHASWCAGHEGPPAGPCTCGAGTAAAE